MIRVITGDCRDVLATLPAESVHCVVTSPPYWGLRDYGIPPTMWGGDPACEHDFQIETKTSELRTGLGMAALGERYRGGGKKIGTVPSISVQHGFCQRCGAWSGALGLEPTIDLYVEHMVEVFRAVRRVMRPDATLWLNLGDSYAVSRSYQVTDNKNPAVGPTRHMGRATPPDGLKQKDLVGIPWRVAFALQADGWWLRQDIIWSKPNPMPESVTDRCTKAHEYIFLLTKSTIYYYDADAVKEEGSGRTPGNKNYKYDGIAGHRTKQGFLAQSNVPQINRNKRSVWTVATEPFSDWTEIVRRERVAWNAPVDGKKRKASLDCPVHGDRHRSLPMACNDAREALQPFCNGSSENHHAQAPPDGSVSIGPNHGRGIVQHSSDLLDQPYSASATIHSSESHKTDLALATNPAYSASAQTPSHTPDKSGARGLFDLVEHMSESNSAPVEMGDSPTSQRADHIVRTSIEKGQPEASHDSDCTCEWYIEKTDKTSHFATFPPALIEPCILAGCPKGGTVLDPFGGAGTTGLVADRLQRNAVLIELNPTYAAMAEHRIHDDAPLFSVGSIIGVAGGPNALAAGKTSG